MNEESKKELTIEELEAELQEISERKNSLHELIKRKKEEEEQKRKEILKTEEEDRKKEIIDVLNKANDLIKKYMADYKSLNITTDNLAYLSYIFGHRYRSFFDYIIN